MSVNLLLWLHLTLHVLAEVYGKFGRRCTSCKRASCTRTNIIRVFGGTVLCYRCRNCGAEFDRSVGPLLKWLERQDAEMEKKEIVNG